jgi:hypothetical protein
MHFTLYVQRVNELKYEFIVYAELVILSPLDWSRYVYNILKVDWTELAFFE